MFHLRKAISRGEVDEVRRIIGSFNFSQPEYSSQGYLFLNLAIKKNLDPQIAELLLSHDCPVNDPENNAEIPLNLAVSRYESSFIEKLLDKGALLDARDQRGNTSLHCAVRSDANSIVSLLLDRGVAVNVLNNEQESPLFLAVSNGNLQLISMLIAHGASVDTQNDEGHSLLHVGACKSYSVVKLLLDHQVPFNVISNSGLSPMHFAVMLEEPDKTSVVSDRQIDNTSAPEDGCGSVIDLLLAHGASADVYDNYGSSPLHTAALYGNFYFVSTLLNHGAPIDIQDDQGRTPLHAAVRSGVDSVVALLLEKGASVVYQDENGNTALHDAVDKKNLTMILKLIDYNAPLNVENGEHLSPLHSAVRLQFDSVVQLLLDRGASTAVCDGFGNSPLRDAVQLQNFKIVSMLLQHGANEKTGKEMPSFLHIAAKAGNLELVRLLVKSGFPVNVFNESGQTPLCVASKSHLVNIVSFLLDSGASTYHQKPVKECLLFDALNFSDYKMVKMLLKKNIFDINTARKIDVSQKYGSILNIFGDSSGPMELKTESDFPDMSEETPLLCAIRSCDYNIVKLILDNNAHVNKKTVDNISPLNLTAALGKENLFILLTDYRARIDEKDIDIFLTLAVKNGCPLIVQYILEHHDIVVENFNESLVNIITKESETFWFKGGNKNFCGAVKELVNHGCNLNAELVNNKYFIAIVVANGYAEILEDFIKQGLNVRMVVRNDNVMRGGHCTLLDVAVKNKQRDIAEVILSRGAFTTADHEYISSLIMKSVENGDAEMTDLLLRFDDVNSNLEWFNHAVLLGSIEILKKFVQHGYDVTQTDSIGRTALFFAVNARGPDSICPVQKRSETKAVTREEIALFLLENVADLGAEIDRCEATLLAAVKHGYLKIVKAFLSHNADVNCRLTRNFRVIPALMDGDDDIDQEPILSDQYCSLLHVVISRHHMIVAPTVDLLLKWGINIEGRNENGETPLHLAVSEQNFKIVRLLLKNGASILCEDNTGKTPVHTSAKNKLVRMFQLLLEEGCDIHSAEQNGFFSTLFQYLEDIEEKELKTNVQSEYPVYDRLYRILNFYVIKLKIAGLIRDESLNLSSNKETLDFQEKCKIEITALKDKNYGDSIFSLYEILICTFSQLLSYMKDENFPPFVKTEKVWKKTYPIYHSILASKLMKVSLRRKLVDNLENILYSIFPLYFSLPELCKESILKKFSDGELRKLVTIVND